MEKINCNVIQDILPLYIDNAVSNDTRTLVESHLESCENCRKICLEIQKDILIPVESVQAEKDQQALRNLKKYLSKKRFHTILVTVIASLTFLVGIIIFMHRYVTYIDYKDINITFLKEDADSVYYKTDIKGNYRWISSYDDNTGEYVFHFEQSLWEKYVDCLFFPFDHIHTILKKDVTKKVYIDSDGTKTTIWEASEEEKETFFQRDQKSPVG